MIILDLQYDDNDKYDSQKLRPLLRHIRDKSLYN